MSAVNEWRELAAKMEATAVRSREWMKASGHLLPAPRKEPKSAEPTAAERLAALHLKLLPAVRKLRRRDQ